MFSAWKLWQTICSFAAITALALSCGVLALVWCLVSVMIPAPIAWPANSLLAIWLVRKGFRSAFRRSLVANDMLEAVDEYDGGLDAEMLDEADAVKVEEIRLAAAYKATPNIRPQGFTLAERESAGLPVVQPSLSAKETRASRRTDRLREKGLTHRRWVAHYVHAAKTEFGMASLLDDSKASAMMVQRWVRDKMREDNWRCCDINAVLPSVVALVFVATEGEMDAQELMASEAYSNRYEATHSYPVPSLWDRFWGVGNARPRWGK
nr:MAG: hypothetical protein 1 [Tombusviridae sp.]